MNWEIENGQATCLICKDQHPVKSMLEITIADWINGVAADIYVCYEPCAHVIRRLSQRPTFNEAMGNPGYA